MSLIFFKRFCVKSVRITSFWKIRTRSYTDRPPPGERSAFQLRCNEWIFVFSNVVLPAYLMYLSDLLEQDIENNPNLWGEPNPGNGLDFYRSTRMGMVAGAMGPMQYFGYKVMEWWIPGYSPRNAFKKLMADQLIISPLTISIFFYGACFLEKKSTQEFVEELKHKFMRLYILDWMYWPSVQYISFRFLEPHVRSLYVSVCILVYDVMLSYFKHARY